MLIQNNLFTAPLRTQGRHILDATDKRFKLASINWYGASDELFVCGGLDSRHRNAIATLIRRLGFNSVRLPYSDELIYANPVIDASLLKANPDLVGMRAIDIYVTCVEALTDAGLAVIINNHITQAGWFDGMNLCDAGWSNDQFRGLCRVTQTEETWIRNWETLMERCRNNPGVIGADLRNEVHGFWGTMRWSNWAPAAERASERLLKINRNWLMFIEGTSSANDLSGVRARPVRLSIPHRVVYSSHVYAWSGWGSMNPYSKRKYTSFEAEMDKNWGYILDQEIAPVWVGEFGAPDQASAGDTNYWKHLMIYLRKMDADWGYWALNPRKPHKNERESYAIIQDDWVTQLEDYRLLDLWKLMKYKSQLEDADPNEFLFCHEQETALLKSESS